jgi:hypothetical protein
LGTKSNQQVLNLANTEGGRAQSLFVGPKNCLTVVALWDGALCVRNRSPDSHMPGLTRRILFRSLSNTAFSYTALIVSTSGTNSLWITPCQSKKITNMVFTRDLWNRRLQCLLVHIIGTHSNGIVLGPHKLRLPFGQFPSHFFHL